MKRSAWSRPLSLVVALGFPLAVLASGCSGGDDTHKPTGSSSSGSGASGSGGSENTGGAGGSGNTGGAGGSEQPRGPVAFTSTPVTDAKVGQPYAYTAKAEQQNPKPGDTLKYGLVKGPTGMNVDLDSGLVSWTPVPGQEGMQDVELTASGPDGQNAQQKFTIDVKPEVMIATLHPAAGSSAGGEPVTIGGYGFLKGKVEVLFGDLLATNVTVVDDTTITLNTPPAVARTRPVTIKIDGVVQATFKPGFTHLPVISSTDVASTKLSSTVKVSGTGFENAAVDPDQLVVPARAGTRRKLVANQGAANSLAAFTLGVGTTDSTLATGAIAIEVHGLRSNFVPLTFTDASIPAELAVTGFDAPHAPGESITLKGAGFAGLQPAALTVTFAGSAAPATVTSIDPSGTLVVVTVPADAVTGPVSLMAAGRLPAQSRVAATITGSKPALAILDATPAGGPPGSALVLRGSGFDPLDANNKVTFDGVEAKVLSSEPDRLVVEVPPGLKFGVADVAVSTGGTTVSAGVFSVAGGVAILAGGGPEEANIGDGGDPLLASLESEFVTTDTSNNYYLADRKRVRLINSGALPITVFGVTIPAKTIQTVAQAPETVTAAAIHPITQDLYFSTGSRIFVAKRADGTTAPYAGTGTAGNGGNGGPRLSASFNGITDLQFSADGLLVIADNNNGAVRAINTTGNTIKRWGLTIAADTVESVAAIQASNPTAIAVDAEGSIYATTFLQLRKIPFDRLAPGAPNYVESVVVAGGGNFSSLPAEGCPAISTSLGVNDGVAFDPTTGNAFLGSRHGLVRRIKASGGSSATTVDTNDCVDFIAGSWDQGKAIPNAGYGGDGGPAKTAVLSLYSRAFADRKGNLLIAEEGRLRQVVFDPMGNPGLITTVAGVGPSKLDGIAGPALRTLNSLGGVLVDDAKNQYVFTTGAQVVGVDRTTNLISVLGGTGYLGNTLGQNGMATMSDLGNLRGLALSGDQLYLLEASLPRVSTIDLGLGTLKVVAGDGRQATLAEQQAAALATMARVDIGTAAPKAAFGPDGALYFADNDLVRVINTTAQAITTFGVTVPPGYIDDLPFTFGTNLSGLAFAPNGDLYAASYDTASLVRVRAAAPFTVDTVVAGDVQRYGVAVPGAVADLHLNRPSDLCFLPDGTLLVANDAGNTLVAVEPNGSGDIGPDSHFGHVFGSGAPGRIQPDDTAPAAAARAVRSVAVDGGKLVLIAGERVLTVDMP
jgi:hypothetical protein